MKNLRLPLTVLYMVFFSLYSLMTRFTVTAGLMDGWINTCFYRFLLLAGILLAVWWLFKERGCFSGKGNKTDLLLLSAFFLVLGISTLSNHAYGIMDNLYGMVTFGFEMVLFYIMGRTLNTSEWNRILKKVILICAVLWDVACSASIVQFLMNISYTIQYAGDHGAVRQGITDGRLFGLFSDPNFAAFTSLLLIWGLRHLLTGDIRQFTRVFIRFSIAVNGIYIVMSNSRTVYLSVVGSIVFYVLLSSYKKLQKRNLSGLQTTCHLFLRAAAAILLTVAAYLFILTALRGAASLICPERDTAVEMVRNDVTKENISNNRFTIWQAYLNLYKEKPVFGFSVRSALPYAAHNNPDGYLAQTGYVTHNSYLSLLVETGAAGFITMGAFVILLVLHSFKRIRSLSEITGTYILFATWLVSILIFCLCFHDIFFTLNLETMLFISSLGFLWQNRKITDQGMPL